MNSLSKDIYNTMLHLEKLKVKHAIITTKNDVPSHIDKALEELRKQWIDSIIDEGIDEHQRLFVANKKHKRKTQNVRTGDN